MASVIFGQQSQCVVEIRVIGAVEARLVGASDDARLLAIDADEIFCTIAKVTADQIIVDVDLATKSSETGQTDAKINGIAVDTSAIVLARIRFAFVDVNVTILVCES